MRNILLQGLLFVGGVSLVTLFFLDGGAQPLWNAMTWTTGKAQSAATFMIASITPQQIQNTYNGVGATDPITGSPTQPNAPKKVRILIVPGHQPTEGGTAFGNVYERDVVVDIADALAALLSQNPHLDVMVSRTKSAWNPILQNYFDTHQLEIDTFRQSQAVQMAQHLADGSFTLEEDQVFHNDTPTAAALQLYGINKWTSDNNYDLTLHIHLNDYPRKHKNTTVGTYDGFSIYVPEKQYSNAVASRAVAEAIAHRLNAYHATSTLPKENVGVVEDQQLIATGSNNSADDAAILIEYGYMYEPQFQNASVLPVAVNDYAYQTYLGIQDFVHDPVASSTGSLAFPYDWTDTIGKNGPDVYALQAALHYLGYYPPKGKSFSDCPISGKSGPCTKTALKAYQGTHGLEKTGALGPMTRAVLLSEFKTSSTTAP